MTQADRVLSTPPTNTSKIRPVDPTRRHLLAIAAGGAIAAGAAVAAAIPITEAATADPAFALIAAKLAADAAHGEAIDAQDEADRDDDPDAEEKAFQRCCVACGVVNEADWRLATTLTGSATKHYDRATNAHFRPDKPRGATGKSLIVLNP